MRALDASTASAQDEERGDLEEFPLTSQDARDQRHAKLEQLLAAGGEPFPHVSFPGRVPISDLGAASNGAAESPDGHVSPTFRIAGRIVSRRKHGKVSFIDLRDQSGSIELYVKLDELGEHAYEQIQHLSVGDIIGAEGSLTTTRRGERAIVARSCTLMAKSLRQPPKEPPRKDGSGAGHVHREIDLMASADAREMFRLRARTTAALREMMDGHGFVEVETPILQTLAGGAAARPFITYGNSLERELSLRISPELYLQRCLVGGIERVYDLGRCFRNEGISHRHSPEFTMLEWSAGYCDYREVAAYTEELIAHVAERALGKTTVSWGDQTIDLSPPWRHCTLREALLEATEVDVAQASAADLAELFDEPVDASVGWACLVDALYTRLVEPNLIEPTIVFDFPIDSLPLVKRHPSQPGLGEAFDVVIGGQEIASGSTALNDPEEQERRFIEQAERGRDGAEGVHPLDQQYVDALRYGLMPSAGVGLGVERLLLVVAERDSVRDVIPFPALSGRR